MHVVAAACYELRKSPQSSTVFAFAVVAAGVARLPSVIGAMVDAFGLFVVSVIPVGDAAGGFGEEPVSVNAANGSAAVVMFDGDFLC